MSSINHNRYRIFFLSVIFLLILEDCYRMNRGIFKYKQYSNINYKFYDEKIKLMNDDLYKDIILNESFFK